MKAILFDFDGVIADSEVPANQALAESLTEIGLPTDYAQSLALYCGHNWQETQRRIEARLGARLPDDFRAIHRARSRARMVDGLVPVTGASQFLARTTHLPRAIASSSHPDYLRWALDRFGLSNHFGSHLYSADGMARGKPYPDIYLRAAAGLAISADQCLAIEDSPVGASAAVAAGARVVGLCVAAHISDRAAHAESLRAVGVHQIAFDYSEILIATSA